MNNLKQIGRGVFAPLYRLLVWLSMAVVVVDFAGVLLAHPFIPWPVNVVAAAVLFSRAALAARFLI
jgi:hypothetical protein